MFLIYLTHLTETVAIDKCWNKKQMIIFFNWHRHTFPVKLSRNSIFFSIDIELDFAPSPATKKKKMNFLFQNTNLQMQMNSWKMNPWGGWSNEKKGEGRDLCAEEPWLLIDEASRSKEAVIYERIETNWNWIMICFKSR